MNLQEQIKDDMANAMRGREKEKLMLLRVLSGEIALFSKSKDVMKRDVKEVTEDDVIKIIRKLSENAKEMKNQSEVEILEKYLPKMLEPKEIKVIVENIIDVNGYSTMKEMGQIMGKIKQNKESTLIDMKVASTYIKELLA